MNDYSPQQYYYYPTEYQPMVWQAIFAVMIDLVILVALGAWALSLVRGALRGEKIKFPL